MIYVVASPSVVHAIFELNWLVFCLVFRVHSLLPNLILHTFRMLNRTEYVCCLLPLTLLCRIRYQISKRYTHTRSHTNTIFVNGLLVCSWCAKSSTDFVRHRPPNAVVELSIFLTYVFRSFVWSVGPLNARFDEKCISHFSKNDQMCVYFHAKFNAYRSKNIRVSCVCFYLKWILVSFTIVCIWKLFRLKMLVETILVFVRWFHFFCGHTYKLLTFYHSSSLPGNVQRVFLS